MSDVWHRALSPTRHVVLGLELSPLTLGHVFLLAKLDSTLLCEDERLPTLQDVILAAFICAQPWRESERDMQRWGFKWFMAWWGWKCRKASWGVEAQLFDSYLCDAKASPEIKAKGELKDRVSPWYWRLLVLLMTQFHFARAQALDTEVAAANLLWITKGEMEDVLELEGKADLSLWEYAHAHDLQVARN
jgi:hypothetical protein